MWHKNRNTLQREDLSTSNREVLVSSQLHRSIQLDSHPTRFNPILSELFVNHIPGSCDLIDLWIFSISACNIMSFYTVICLNYLSPLWMSINLPFTPMWQVVTKNVQLAIKPNLARTPRFTLYAGVYYITTYSEVLTCNETPVPGVWHQHPQLEINFCT